MCNMKKILTWAMAAALICGASVLTSCSSNDDNPATSDLGVSDKIIGKWIEVEIDGQPAPNRGNSAVTFVSATKAYYSSSRPDYTETQLKWSAHREYNVKIEGNTVTLTGHPESEPELTLQEDFIITSITATEMVCKYRHTTIRDGKVSGQPVEKNARLEFKADGTYNFYRKDEGGQWQPVTTREFQDYFVDGYLVNTRWKDAGAAEQREWWEIASIADDQMEWTALRQNADGSTFVQGTRWKKIL